MLYELHEGKIRKLHSEAYWEGYREGFREGFRNGFIKSYREEHPEGFETEQEIAAKADAALASYIALYGYGR